MSDLRVNSDVLDIGLGIKRTILADIKGCRYGRAEIAHLLSGEIGRPITLAQLDAFTSESKTHRFPLDLLAAWVKITGSRRLLDLVVPAAGYSVADERDSALARYGKTILDREELELREAKLRAELKAQQ